MMFNPFALLLLLSGSNSGVKASNVKHMKAFAILLKACVTQGLLTDGLLRLYRGNGDALDVTGNGPNLTGEAGYTEISFPQSGNTRKVFDFVNTQNGLMGPAVGLPSGSNDRSILGWFRWPAGQLTDGGRSDGDPFGYGNHVGNNDYYVEAYPSGGQYRIDLDVNGHDEGINPILVTPPTTWIHLVIMYNKASNTNVVYLNGQYLKTGTPSIVPDTVVNDPLSRIYIGQHTHTGRSSWANNAASYRGQVADVAVFDRVLTSQEVEAIYTNDNWYLNAGGGGDPHFQGFGGRLFTWQGACDIVLLTTTLEESNVPDNLTIHIRTRRVRQWSAIDAISLKVGNNVAEIGSKDGKLHLNGSQVNVINDPAMSVRRAILKKKKLTYKFTFYDTKYLEVTTNTRTNMIYVNLSGNYSNATKGVLGSPIKPGLYGRDGADMSGDVNVFIESWQVTNMDPQLFREQRYPQYPEKCVYETKLRNSNSPSKERRLKQKSSISLEEAISACAIHRPGPLQQFCISDVFQTGELTIAEDVFYG